MRGVRSAPACADRRARSTPTGLGYRSPGTRPQSSESDAPIVWLAVLGCWSGRAGGITSGDGALCVLRITTNAMSSRVNRRADELVHQVARNFIGMTG